MQALLESAFEVVDLDSLVVERNKMLPEQHTSIPDRLKTEMKESFYILDTDHDGLLHRDQLERLVWRLDPEITKEEMADLLETADINSDGMYDIDEYMFLMFLKWNDQDNMNDIKEAFKVFDKDGNEVLSREEFGFILMKLGEPLEEDEVGAILDHFDRDGSGEIDFEEFAYVMTGPHLDDDASYNPKIFKRCQPKVSGNLDDMNPLKRILATPVSRTPSARAKNERESNNSSDFIPIDQPLKPAKSSTDKTSKLAQPAATKPSPSSESAGKNSLPRSQSKIDAQTTIAKQSTLPEMDGRKSLPRSQSKPESKSASPRPGSTKETKSQAILTQESSSNVKRNALQNDNRPTNQSSVKKLETADQQIPLVYEVAPGHHLANIINSQTLPVSKSASRPLTLDTSGGFKKEAVNSLTSTQRPLTNNISRSNSSAIERPRAVERYSEHYETTKKTPTENHSKDDKLSIISDNTDNFSMSSDIIHDMNDHSFFI